MNGTDNLHPIFKRILQPLVEAMDGLGTCEEDQDES